MLAWVVLLVPAIPGAESGPNPGEIQTLGNFPPALSAPEAAREQAALIPISEGTRAELSLLTRDPAAALEHARNARHLPSPRRLRLMADARVQLGHTIEAEALLARLEKHAGWERHVARQRSAMTAFRRVRTTTRTGLAVYALALGALVLGGMRQLLRLDGSTAIMLALTVVAVFVARLTWPPLGLVVGFAGLSATFLVHAGAATLSRLEPGPRPRLFVAFIVVLGAVGVWAALAVELARAVWTS